MKEELITTPAGTDAAVVIAIGAAALTLVVAHAAASLWRERRENRARRRFWRSLAPRPGEGGPVWSRI